MSTFAQKEEIPQGLPFLGNAMLFLGLAILALSLTGTSWLPFNMPRSWFQNPTIWKLLALCLSFGGIAILKQVSQSEMKSKERTSKKAPKQDWTPDEPGQRFEALTFYTKEDCPLCEEAAEILEDYAAYLPPVERIDIYSNPELIEKFGTCVPVVVLDNKIRFRGRINEVLLRRLIVATPAKVVSQKNCDCNKQDCNCKRQNTEADSNGCGSNCRCA